MSKRSPSTYHIDGYPVRESVRAKHLSIRVSRQAEVEVVVPVGYPKAQIKPFLVAKQHWIQRTVNRVNARNRAKPTIQREPLPTRIPLRSRDEDWAVEYCASPSDRITLTIPEPYHLCMEGTIDNHQGCREVLRRWLRQYAQHRLPQWLSHISQSIQLPYRRVTIRHQKTIWGSCSTAARISLNDKLLFLPMPLVRYVLVHELCHTVHMNHSPDFWALVATHEPQYRSLKAALKTDGQRYMPDWLEL